MTIHKIEYSGQYTDLSHDQLVQKLKETLTTSRFEHVLRVEQTAVDLAQQYGANIEKASIAGLVHDYAKQRPDDDFIAAIKQYRLPSELLNYGNAIWHGVVGWIFVKNELGIDDLDILHAVQYHTVGHQYMNQLAQIIYMADYIEPGRYFPGVTEAREITHQSLAEGVAYQTQQTLKYLVENRKPVYPQTIVTYNAWVTKRN